MGCLEASTFNHSKERATSPIKVAEMLKNPNFSILTVSTPSTLAKEMFYPRRK